MAEGIKKISENVIIDKRALVITDPTVADNTAISIGALQSNPSTKGLKIKTGSNTYSLFDAEQVLIPGSIVTKLYANLSVTTDKLANLSVTEPKLGNGSVTEIKVGTDAITEPKIKASAVTSSKIKRLNILTDHYADSSIVNIKLVNKTLTGEKIADETLETRNYGDDSVTALKIASNQILERHYGDNSISNEHYKNESMYGSKIKNLGIENKHLAINSVNTINMLNGCVNKDKLGETSIFGYHFNKNIVENIHLTASCVLSFNLSDDSVTTPKVVNKSITKEKLAEDVVSLIGDPVMYEQDNYIKTRSGMNVQGDIHSSGTITAKKVLNSVFMDLAEAYIPGEELERGDIVEIREDGKVYKCKEFSVSTVGIISTEYASCYGATQKELDKGSKVAVALVGKVPVKISGPVNIGDRILAGENGIGYVQPISIEQDLLLKFIGYSIIGKAIESSIKEGIQTVQCLVYPS